ncbi:MAG: hypothetical protein ACTS9Y_02795 [Methylophilus sp.]|uniref:hypothetical protein n=1 Tax=Methylophilus sp. TaxID=29541 RepID=UPI003F9EC003
MINIIKKGLLLCALLVSAQAEAKVVAFQESFSGYFSRDIVVDAGWFQGQTNFVYKQSTLSTQYDLIDDGTGLFLLFGTFNRTDQSTNLNGYFDISLFSEDLNNPPDPWLYPDIPVSVWANFYAEESFIDPATGDIVRQTVLSGVGKGLLAQREYLSLNVDWLLSTSDTVSTVPAPPVTWLFATGLLMIGGLRLYKRN